ncbi:hypothetical protein M231_04478 [Tremella mesenterica]|uniref:DUF7729 domain-containing protein n=1 Tax=Tremella mesenterica TaxID=5217 RepID=A0A4Q1BKN3_TREME|nr:hypothetical protein M231_04478 [Tremella mesenterica]
MRVHTVLVGVSVGVLSVNALSAGCEAQVGLLAIGSVGSCLALTSLLPVLSTNGSIIDPLNAYLSTLCASSTPTCDNSTLSSAQSSVSSACSSDISAGGTGATEIDGLLTILKSYPQIYGAGCSKNSTSSGYCVTETLTTIQNDTNSQITTSFLTSLLSGDSTALSTVSSALGSGNLCTGCVEQIYLEALSANATISSSPVGSALTSQCGSSFGQTTPSGVSTTSVPVSTSSAAASSGSGAERGSVMMPFAVVGTLFLGVIGGALLV